MEATGYSRWFERLLAELGFELWIADPAEIKAKRVKKLKTDRKDAQLLLRLMPEKNFPQIWVPIPENRDLRQRLWHRHRLVQMRTRIMNQLQALAMKVLATNGWAHQRRLLNGRRCGSITSKRSSVPRPPLSLRLTPLGRSAVQIFAANERMNQLLIEHLDPAAWRAKPSGKTRPIVAIFTHMHNVRAKWIRLTTPHLKVPKQLHRTRCTPQQACAALAESAARCTEMLAEALYDQKRRIANFCRDGWAPSWPVGPEMLCYMLAHEAHHRGQVCMLAHQLGFPLPYEASDGIWNWEKLWKAGGSPAGPGYDS